MPQQPKAKDNYCHLVPNLTLPTITFEKQKTSFGDFTH